MELRLATTGIGLIGFLGFWNRSFWLPYIITRSVFLIGAGITHVIHIVQHGNFSPSNVGIVLYWDFIFPIVLIVMYALYKRSMKAKAEIDVNA